MKFSLAYKTTLPDVALYELFDRMIDADRVEVTFHDGEVRTYHQFRDLMRRPDLHMWVLLGDGQPLGMLWVTDVRHGAGNTHFCMLGTAHPVTDVRGARFIVSRVLRLHDEQGEYLLHALHGKTPVRNHPACKWLQLVGFKAVGEMPLAVWMEDSQQLEPALISTATRESAPECWGA